MTIEEKNTAHDILCKRLAEQQQDVADIEPRLLTYFNGLRDELDSHNGWEILCGVKFLRLLRTYDFNHRKVKQVIRLREGEWEQNGSGMWRHVKGGIACPGTSHVQVYRWEPFQVFVLASVFGFRAWIDTQITTDDRQELLPTERLNGNRIEDLRRLCTDFTFYAPRKTDKTGLSAFIQVVFFLLEDHNAEIYCTANSSDQAKIAYARTQMMLRQMDDGSRIRMTQTVTDWRPQYQNVRNTQIRPLSAGGKTKDGMFAQLCCADEYGSAGYTNGRSDMKMLVDVVTSSMGPRREPLTFTTTTAGRVHAGPFIEKLDSLHRVLLREIEWDTDASDTEVALDRMLCVCYEPDDWEKTDEALLLTDKKIRAKINPMLGKIVQHQFYDDSVAKAKMDGDLGEVVSKLFNVYDSARVTSWLQAEQILPRQRKDRRIGDCRYTDGWNIFVGMDYGGTDDLWAHAYLGVNYTQAEPQGRFFADCDAWITRKAFNESPNKALYELWESQGWLTVYDGEVIEPSVPINTMMSRSQDGLNFIYFGFDPAQSKQPINTLKAWLQSLGIESQVIKQMVVPVSQSFLTFNGLINDIEYLLLSQEGFLELSASPLWPWCFGNCRIETSTGGELRKVLKTNVNQKVDVIHALLDALYAFNLSEGQTA